MLREGMTTGAGRGAVYSAGAREAGHPSLRGPRLRQEEGRLGSPSSCPARPLQGDEEGNKESRGREECGQRASTCPEKADSEPAAGRADE